MLLQLFGSIGNEECLQRHRMLNPGSLNPETRNSGLSSSFPFLRFDSATNYKPINIYEFRLHITCVHFISYQCLMFLFLSLPLSLSLSLSFDTPIDCIRTQHISLRRSTLRWIWLTWQFEKCERSDLILIIFFALFHLIYDIYVWLLLVLVAVHNHALRRRKENGEIGQKMCCWFVIMLVGTAERKLAKLIANVSSRIIVARTTDVTYI